MFEHILTLEDLEKIVSLVDPRGVFALHTVVKEEIPAEPNWFYLLPVHCSFFTNRSMEILFNKWAFYASLYDPESRMWFWFKENRMEEMERFATKHSKSLFIKKGFADYWK